MYYIFAVGAHDQEFLCRVLDRKHTANCQAHGKEPDSGSERWDDGAGAMVAAEGTSGKKTSLLDFF